MSDLKMSSGSGGTSDVSLRAKGLKRTQEVAKEERVSSKTSSSGAVIVWGFKDRHVVIISNFMSLPFMTHAVYCVRLLSCS